MFKPKDFVKIKPGSFVMGSPPTENGRYGDETQRGVTISEPFEMQTTQITQAQWEKVMGNNPSNHKGKDLPVEMISFDDLQEFIKKLNSEQKKYTYSLPTEEEWEYCCRAGSKTVYSFGDDPKDLQKYAWYYENSENKTHPVGKKNPNKWGLYDMHGNVWEWCDSFYYKDGSGSNRVIRGGSWWNRARFVRSAYRYGGDPGIRLDSVGGRLVRTLSSALLPSSPCPGGETRQAIVEAALDKLKEVEKLLRSLK